MAHRGQLKAGRCPAPREPRGATVKAMPKRRDLTAQPYVYLRGSRKKDWPEGTLIKSAPQAAHFIKAVAQRLKDKLAEDDAPSAYALAEAAGISRQAISNILQGTTWSDLPTIYRLEVALQQRLWINEDIP